MGKKKPGESSNFQTIPRISSPLQFGWAAAVPPPRPLNFHAPSTQLKIDTISMSYLMHG